VTAKLSTYDMIRVLGISIWREATYMTKRKGEIGEQWGTPTETGRKYGETLEGKTAGVVPKEGSNPLYEIETYTLAPEKGDESR